MASLILSSSSGGRLSRFNEHKQPSNSVILDQKMETPKHNRKSTDNLVLSMGALRDNASSSSPGPRFENIGIDGSRRFSDIAHLQELNENANTNQSEILLEFNPKKDQSSPENDNRRHPTRDAMLLQSPERLSPIQAELKISELTEKVNTLSHENTKLRQTMNQNEELLGQSNRNEENLKSLQTIGNDIDSRCDDMLESLKK